VQRGLETLGILPGEEGGIVIDLGKSRGRTRRRKTGKKRKGD